jgi:hypothetical protein
MVMCYTSTNSMQAQRARIIMPHLAVSKPLACCKDGTFESNASLYAGYIGKGSNNLEEVESGTIHSPQTVYTEFRDPHRDEGQTKILPALKKVPVSTLVRLSHKSASMLARARAGHRRPRVRNQKLLAAILRRIGIVLEPRVGPELLRTRICILTWRNAAGFFRVLRRAVASH